MGLVGLLITVVIMVLGMGYLYFGNSKTSLTVNNESTKTLIVQELEQGQSALQAAHDVKNLVEQKAAETMRTEENPAATGSPKANEATSLASDGGETSEAKVASEAPAIVNRLMSSGFSVPSKSRSIDTIVLHSSYDLNGSDPYSVSGIIKEYEDYGVSAHYLIDRKGTMYRLVEDKNIAYHAGVSKMPDGRTGVNDFSIGIEMMNTEKGQFTSAQYTAVNNLIATLKKQYPIKSIVGHQDIAPGRKTDPWNFDWKKLK